MLLRRALAVTSLAATIAFAAPAAPALANGAASTRNIIFGLGAATYLVIQHNRKVHEKYAEDARRQAELQSENHDAWAAYSSEKRAYGNSLAEITDLKREVAYQHAVIMQQRHALAMNRGGGAPVVRRVAYAPPARHQRAQRHAAVRHTASRPDPNTVAAVSYGWGNL
ncbi:MAG TPA: hypothetical protein VFE17_06590 [Candidatus Baltobacteraceae bacterium]|jgi:hypothetical protein|nr:hypothetical protein [Candidatus Baltobacteraceae bacterium]